MFRFKFKFLLFSCILQYYFIDISLQQGTYDDGTSGLDDVASIWQCNGTDITIRTIEGTCNNLKHSNWGAPNRVFDHGFFTPPYYDDSFSGSPKVNIDCRLLSNELSDNGQPPTFTGNPLGDDILSSTRKSIFELFFGQFINHDLEDNALQSSTPGISIADITNDYVFNTQPGNIWNPKASPYMTITLSLGRVLNSTLYPANKGNAYLDLSAIYGTNVDDAFGLRERAKGLLTLSNFQTSGGVYNAKLVNVTVENVAPNPLDTDVFPSLNDPPIPVDKAMVSGDSRASENVQLAIIHTIWIREHNFQAKQILAKNPNFDDETVFQMARKITIAEYQHVVYNEFLPSAIGYKMPPYGGYNENIYADTTTYFSSAAFRYGHTQIRPYNIIDGCTNELITLHPDFNPPNSHPNRFFYVGRSIAVPPPQGSALTQDQFDYTPARMMALASGTSGSGIDNILVSMLREVAAEFDLMITTPLRHMPAVIDLFATDIGRGRLNGLRPYNEYRAAFHPAGDLYNDPACNINAPEDSLACFSVITKNQTIAATLKKFYIKVNTIDAIVGFFAEDKLFPTNPLPPTISKIIFEEFEKKRYGDRFWYEGDQYTEAEKALIRTVTMKQIIERNFNIINVQKTPFKEPGAKDTIPMVSAATCKGPAKGAKGAPKGGKAPADAPPAAPPAPPAGGGGE